jgi:hypothetical protein
VVRIALAGLLLVAAALRLHALDVEPWFDEIQTHLRLAKLSAGQIAATYDSQNHHVLYSLLAKLSLTLFGDTVEALRLPAVAFGILGVAAVYALGKQVASAREGLLAAALLAVSYHHIWFSQNARGYTALAFFSLVATSFLLRALEEGRRRDWIGYGVVAALGVYTHLTMLWVVAAHAAVALWALTRRSAARARSPLARTARSRWLLGLGVFTVLVLVAYAPILPELWAINATQGRSGLVPEWSRLSWFAREVAVALGAAFAGAPLAVAVLLLAAAGLWRLARRRPVVGAPFVLPAALTAVVLVASGHHLWPRFFFFAIGFGALAVTSGAFAAGDRLARLSDWTRGLGPAIGTALAVSVVIASATTVPAAYAPKQSFLAARDLVRRERRPDDAVLVLRPAQQVFADYYGEDWRVVTALADLERMRSASGRTWLVASFPVTLRSRHADLRAMLDAEFSIVGRFEGTLHDGTVLVWRAEPRNGTTPPSPAPGAEDPEER